MTEGDKEALQPPSIDESIVIGDPEVGTDPINSDGLPVGLGVQGLRAIVSDEALPPQPRFFPGEADYVSTAERLSQRPMADNRIRRNPAGTRRVEPALANDSEEVARKLLSAGRTLEDVSRKTGMSLRAIRAIQRL